MINTFQTDGFHIFTIDHDLNETGALLTLRKIEQIVLNALKLPQQAHHIVVDELSLFRVPQQALFAFLLDDADALVRMRDYIKLDRNSWQNPKTFDKLNRWFARRVHSMLDNYGVCRVEPAFGFYYLVAKELPKGLLDSAEHQEKIAGYVTGNQYDEYFLCDDTGRKRMDMYGSIWDMKNDWDNVYYPALLRHFREKKLKLLIE